jgi:hypothetical protein
MPVIEREFIPPKKEQLNVRLDPDALELLNQYCVFIESSQHYVVQQALRFMFGKDRDFQNWLSAQGTTGESTGAPGNES